MADQYNSYLRSEENLYFDLSDSPNVFEAVLMENIQELERFKFNNEFSLNLSDVNGNTPLHIAVIKNKLKSIEYLVAQDVVSVDARNIVGQTPLFNACRSKKIEITRKLLEAGASINIKDCQENTPVHMSIDNSEITHILIKNGADINVVNIYKNTPLHNAVTVENLETVCLLLYYNCDATVKNYEGNTPFMDSLIYENIKVQTALFEYVEDFNICSSDNDTILTLALTYQSPFVEEILLRGAKVNRRSLESSLMSNNHKIFEIIWKRISNVDLENSNLLDKFVYGMRRNNILTYIDIILENSDDSLLEALANCFNCQHSFMDLVEECASIRGLEQLTRLTCVLLEYNCRFFLTTVFQIYYYFGYCDLFKYFLFMDNREENDDIFKLIIPMYIYNINSDIKEICEYLTLYSTWDTSEQKAAIRSLEYSLDLSLVQLLDKYFYDKQDYILVKKQLLVVPSLLQLARDKTRKYIVNKFNFSRPSQFYTYINNIDIGTVYKQIITLERKIYNFDFK